MMLELPPIKGAYIRNDVPGVYSTLGLTSKSLHQYYILVCFSQKKQQLRSHGPQKLDILNL